MRVDDSRAGVEGGAVAFEEPEAHGHVMSRRPTPDLGQFGPVDRPGHRKVVRGVVGQRLKSLPERLGDHHEVGQPGVVAHGGAQLGQVRLALPWFGRQRRQQDLHVPSLGAAVNL